MYANVYQRPDGSWMVGAKFDERPAAENFLTKMFGLRLVFVLRIREKPAV